MEPAQTQGSKEREENEENEGTSREWVEEVEIDSETDESNTESIQSIVRPEDEERAAVQVAEVEVPEARMTPAIRQVSSVLGHSDMRHLLSKRAVVMKRPPKFFRGAYPTALRIASRKYHCGQNNYRFDALQFDCFRINIKL